MPRKFRPPEGKSLAQVDPFEDAYEEHCALIEGVVEPGRQGSLVREEGDYNIHLFGFAAWRHPGKPLVERGLTLLRAVPPLGDEQEGEVNALHEFPAYSIQRLSVLLSKDQTRAVVEKALTMEAPDEALRAFSDGLQEPVVVSTEQFGELVLDELGRFEGEVEWNGSLIDVYFVPNEDGELESALKTAEALWRDQAGWKRKIDEYAVQRLLPLKNRSWLKDGETQLTAEAFKARMELTHITVADEGRFEFWHDDGGLFWEHSIQICGDLKNGPTDAGIQG